ncbi:hypothetical protein [Methanocaldococcus fervens]|uniref:Uncharacterized protein n=1 Tax=Methanocaldococcus fervens (strain DSM 4213 / JCM 15782 / AG86) TaxID=573064 RepID=C7P9P5_METFA|nr:hypothetical protein [Methanocaldococcus fervens]ACV25402.1 hypothetical protein Mefer_1599 [Methanocaldococcus fervens AG86]
MAKKNHAFYAKNLNEEEKAMIDIVKALIGADNKGLLIKGIRALIRERNLENEVERLLEERKKLIKNVA